MSKRTLTNPADKQQIVERLQRIQPSSARQWGKMTAPQMVCHLADSFRVTIGEKTWATERISVTPIPLPRRFVKWVALDVPLAWPRGVKTRPEVDQEHSGTLPQAFEADLADLRRLLDRFYPSAQGLRVAGSSNFRDDERRRVDALGLPSHGPPSPAVWGLTVSPYDSWASVLSERRTSC